ncbi:putative succinate-semialdehyde dehydrogenase [Trichoderma compactum]
MRRTAGGSGGKGGAFLRRGTDNSSKLSARRLDILDARRLEWGDWRRGGPAVRAQESLGVFVSWVQSIGGYLGLHPATQKIIGKCPEFSQADTEKAIEAAAAAFPAFKTLTARERARLLRKWFQLIIDNIDELALLLTLENGKTITEAKGEIGFAAGFVEYYSEEAVRIYGDTIPASVDGKKILTLKEPVGVCALITPWNFPSAMITRKAAPALAAGCTVVIKVPGETPFSGLALAELARQAGFPKGVINVITALDNTVEVGSTLTHSPLVQKVSFTGSTAVGKLLMEQASSTMKRVSFELGGNAPLIVFDDANVDHAVEEAIASKFRSSGQSCVCANRLYVHESIHDEFVRKYAAVVRRFKVGSGLDASVSHGPLIHERAAQKVHSHILDAVGKGAKVVVGGALVPSLGQSFYLPTVLTGMKANMLLAQEETFGPVAGIFSFNSDQQAVSLANESDVGLAAYLFGKDVSRLWRVAEALQVGMVGINTGIISDNAAPWTGVKQSGIGREGGKYGIEEYLATKTITVGGLGSHLKSRI